MQSPIPPPHFYAYGPDNFLNFSIEVAIKTIYSEKMSNKRYSYAHISFGVHDYGWG